MWFRCSSMTLLTWGGSQQKAGVHHIIQLIYMHLFHFSLVWDSLLCFTCNTSLCTQSGKDMWTLRNCSTSLPTSVYLSPTYQVCFLTFTTKERPAGKCAVICSVKAWFKDKLPTHQLKKNTREFGKVLTAE